MRRVLVVNPFGIGDILFITPFLRCISEQEGVEFIDVLVGSRTHDVLKDNPSVRQIQVVDWDLLRGQSRIKTFFDAAKLLRKLSKNRYDHYFDFSSTRTYAFFAKYVLRIPKRIGFNYKGRGSSFTDKVEIPNGYDEKPVIEYYLDLARSIGIKATRTHPEFYVQENHRLEAERLLSKAGISPSDRVITVAPGGGASWGKDAFLKQWSPARFKDLLRYCKDRLNAEGIVVLGAHGEERLADCLLAELDGCILNAAGKTKLGVTAALIERSSMLLANDGGMVHLARALDCPCCAIFGPVSEVVYGLYPEGDVFVSVSNDAIECRPCYKRFRYKSDCVKRECLEDLTVDCVTRCLEERHFFDKVKSISAQAY